MALSPEFREYRRKLNRLSDKAFPEVVAATLNNVSKYADIKQKQNLKNNFTIRNRYTERSLKRWKAKPKKHYYKINSILGTISPYMDLHESGGIKRPKRGDRIAMPTVKARRGRRDRVVSRKYYVGKTSENMFTGVPKGGGRPLGVYERRNRNKKLVMIKNLEKHSLRIKKTNWHTAATRRYAKADFIQQSFTIAARKYITDSRI